MFTFADSHTEVSILGDLGANVPVNPYQEGIRNPSMVNRSCTFGKKGKLQVLAMTYIELIWLDKGRTEGYALDS